MQPQVSVVVPVYNTAAYLSSCIESILGQTCPDFELILVDDGSTDQSGVICDQFAQTDTRVRVLHTANGGVSSARNTGLAAADGRYVVFCDSDDTIAPTLLAVLLERSDSDLAECGIHLGQEQRVYESDQTFLMAEMTAQVFTRLLQKSLISSPCAKLYRMDLIRRFCLQFDTSVNYGEDLIFNLSYLQHCRSYTSVAQCLYFYKFAMEGSLTNHFTKTRLYCYYKIREQIDLFMRNFNIPTVEMDDYLFEKYDQYMYSHFKLAVAAEGLGAIRGQPGTPQWDLLNRRYVQKHCNWLEKRLYAIGNATLIYLYYLAERIWNRVTKKRPR